MYNEGTIYGFFSLSRRVGSTIANSASVLIIFIWNINKDVRAKLAEWKNAEAVPLFIV